MLNWLKQVFGFTDKTENPGAQKNPGAGVRQNIDTGIAELDYKNKGDAFLDQGDWAMASIFYRQAIAINPGNAVTHNNLGLALAEQRQYDAAVAHLKQAILLNQNSFNAHYTLGTIAQRLGDLDEAIAHFWNAVSAKPDFSEALDYLGFLFREKGDTQKSVECYRRALAINPLSPVTHSSLLFALLFDETLTPSELHAEHVRFAERFEAPLTDSGQSHCNEKNLHRRLKIGYVSPDFRRHSVALFMMPVLIHHDKEQFEIFCYYNHATGDDFTNRFASVADHFIACSMMSDDELCERIRADKIDILIDLTGHTAENRMLAFARKPAPVQITYLGYPGTSGLSAMDYRLTDNYTDPEGSDRYYTEKLLRLPDSMWCYQPEEADDVTPLPALENGYLTFGSFNNVNKVGDDCIKLWANLLRSIPTARMLMATVPEGEIRERLKQRFTVNGVASDRITFCGKLPKNEFLQLFQQVDISLDPFPINGATTTCESLWQGVPVLTLIGNRFLTRAGLSILSAAKLSEFAAATEADYLNTATELANNLPRLAGIRAGMREHLLASPLLDVKRFTQNLENLYRQAWATWCNVGEIAASGDENVGVR